MLTLTRRLAAPDRDPLVGWVSGFLIAVAFVSGRFSLDRIGLPGVEARVILVPPLAIWTMCLLLTSRRLVPARLDIPTLTVLLVWTAVLAATGFWSHAPSAGLAKFVDLIVLALIGGSTGILLARNRSALTSVATVLALFAAVYAAVSIVALLGGARGTIGVGGPNVTTRVIFLGLLAGLFLVRNEMFLVRIVFTVLAIAGIVAVGSRGGIVGALAAVLFCLGVMTVRTGLGGLKTFRFGLGSLAQKAIALGIVMGLSVFFLLPLMKDVFDRRIVNLLINRVHMAGRDEIASDTWKIIVENPLFGVGLGGYVNYDIQSVYPHNLGLEMMADGGVGMAMFVVLFGVLVLYRSWRLPTRSTYFVVGAFYMLVVQQVSGDYYDFRYYFLMLLCAHAARSENESCVIRSRFDLGRARHPKRFGGG